MTMRSLHVVMGEILNAVSCHPELAASVFHFLFEQENLREGLAISTVGIDGTEPARLSLALWASPRLEQFARAVSQGFVPEMALQSAAVGD